MKAHTFREDTHRLKSYYLHNKKAVFKNLSLAALFFFVAMAVVGFRVLYPFHLLLAVPFLLFSVSYFIALFLVRAESVASSRSYLFAKRYIVRYEKLLFVLSLLGVVLYIGSRLVPYDANPFEGLRQDQVVEVVHNSVDQSVLYIDAMETATNELLETGLLDNEELSADELHTLLAKWNEFLQATKDSEDVTDVYRYFAKVSYFSMPDEHAMAFVISYSLYLKKYELFGRVIDRVDGNDRVTKALNEYSEVFGAKNSYNDVRSRHVDHETLLRRNIGRAYTYFLEHTVDMSSFGENFQTLLRESKESHRYLLTHVADTATVRAEKFAYNVEAGLFNSWFPVQKNVANTMGNILVSSRKETFITIDQVREMKPKLTPGDILIERRNWHASNVGIPGFWPHAALYVGTVAEADEYFKDVFPYEGYDSYSQLIQDKYPSVYAKNSSVDEDGYAYAVIEGQAPGIIMLPLEKSAKADYLGVLRPRVDKRDTLQAVLRAFGNYGKPYDYNFDFETRDEIVCSELVYDAYLPQAGKKGVTFELSLTSGRKMLSPNNIVKKYFKERGTPSQELDFVYFIDGNEQLGVAFVKDEVAFMTSFTRPKFSRLQE